jgi:nicotinate (nicotinamide) nucleotide adenylyltransferase/dephospho-CoA kinase
MSLLLFGGSFDPIHNGHIAILNHLIKTYPNLSSIELLPTPQNPQKGRIVAQRHRYAMLSLVIDQAFGNSPIPVRLNPFELEQKTPCYTVDTLKALRQRGYPPLQWVIGADQWATFHTWKSPLMILTLLEKLIVINRPDASKQPLLTIPDHLQKKIEFTSMPPNSVSSTEIRYLIRKHHPLSEWTPPYIAEYIQTHHLYTQPEEITPKVFGLSGRVGSGKSTAQSCIQTHIDAHIIDLDRVGHECLNRTHIQEKLIQKWGPSLQNTDGQINRSQLSALVFNPNTPENLAFLNQMIHPEIRQEVEKRLKTYTQEAPKAVFIVGALLTEIGLKESCDHVIVIDTDDTRIEKSIGEKFKKIAPTQRSRESYLQEADFVLHNTHSPTFCLDLIKLLLLP